MSERIRLLFVDDQPEILSGLQRMLHKERKTWDMEFAASGAEALQMMAQNSFDVVVADMMMPAMNGAQLLQKVKELYPGTVRYVLSGQSDWKMVLQAVGSAHQYIAKPCEPEQLKEYLNRSMGLRQLVTEPALHQRIAAIGSLPSPPRIYNALMTEIQSDEASLQRIGEIISEDMSLTAKVLQMVNSAFFGLPTHVESPLRAVHLLGLDTVQGLVLAAGVFNQFDDPGLPGFAIEGIYRHSIQVGSNAKRVAKALELPSRMVEDSLLAGLLHDIGKLLLAANFRDEFSQAMQWAQQHSCRLHEAEAEVIGVSHAEVGAHLMSLWGLPDSILEAIALHHNPNLWHNLTIGPLAAVHIANALDQPGASADNSEKIPDLDYHYLEQLGIADRVDELVGVCEVEAVEEGVGRE
ncbi:MAG: response regulator [bacterium]